MTTEVRAPRPATTVTRAQRRLPSRTGTLPAAVTLVLLSLFAVVFVFSPTLNPIDILAGRFLEVPVPRIVGLTQDRALVELERGRLHGDVSFVYSSKVPRGKVARQEPAAASTLRRGSDAKVFVSRGPAYVTLPALTGTKRSDAIKAIRKLGLDVSEERLNDEAVPIGTIIGQKPAAGAVVEGGSTVEIKVSTGPVTRTVPEVAGLPVEGAAFMLGKAGFMLGTLTLADNPLVAKGGVVGTDPPAATVLPRDTPVNLVVSNGPPPVNVPKVTGITRAAAAEELTRLGLIIGEVTQTGAVADPLDGVVLGQSPDPGTQLRPGQVVTLTVRRAAVPAADAPAEHAPARHDRAAHDRRAGGLIVTAVRHEARVENEVTGPRLSAVGAPEIVDPRRTTGPFLLVMACVLAGLALSMWALTDSLRGSTAIELPRLEVPAVQTLDIAQARAQLESAGFAVEVQFQPNEEEAKGVVIGQKPLAGSKVEQGELVVVLASDGPLGQSVPDVEGQQSLDAVATMQASGLTVEVVPTASETIRPNEVIDTEPTAGARVPVAGQIRLLVSSGPAPRLVPTVMTKTTEQALADIGRAGLAVGKIKRVFRPDLQSNTVFEVDPPEGTPLPRDTPINLTVAGPEPTSKVPYLVGLHQASAERVAKLAEVKIKVVTSPVAAGDPLEGRVISQGVPPQAEVPVDFVIEITVAVVPVPVAAPTTAPPAPTTAPGG